MAQMSCQFWGSFKSVGQVAQLPDSLNLQQFVAADVAWHYLQQPETGLPAQRGKNMQPIGYLYKTVAKRPDWIKTENVSDIFSLSNCVSEDFAEYINYWHHNGYWLFDSPEIIRTLAEEHLISLDGTRLFYYEAHEEEYDDTQAQWRSFSPEASFATNIQEPEHKTLQGFDVTSFTLGTSPECSPLSCNSLAEIVTTNQHCLFNTYGEARRAIEHGVFKNTEPGPYRIIAVYTVP
jgi:hypothetical protein